MAIKISPIQKRLNAGKYSVGAGKGLSARAVPVHISSDALPESVQKSGTPYFAYMSAKNAMRIVHKNAYVISIRNPGAEPFAFDCKEQYNLFVDAGARSISAQSTEGLGEFILKALAQECPVIHVHCSYGEVRSYTVVDVLQEIALHKGHDSQVWQVQESGKWVTGSNTTGSFDDVLYRAVHHSIRKASKEK